MACQIKWSERAYQNLEYNFEFIARDSLNYAKIFVKGILNKINLLKNHPYSGKILPEMNKKEYRQILYKNYRIIYKIANDKNVEILLIRHGSIPIIDIE
ncbi:MAG: type II toxin-antitoxin system RelE/ParE family toxin [Spirochaetia bacterium]|nr:type II toxin-antitoxin system RelE/ParE family toxin [Spirochaetia bacterium]